MSNAAVVETPPRTERGPALRPIVGRLLNAMVQHSVTDGVLKIGIKEYTLEISAWERGIVLEVKEQGLANSTYWGYRLLEALAVQAKGFADLNRLKNDPLSDEQCERCRRDLVSDYALGKALEAELAAVITALDETDRKGPARNLSSTRQRLAENLGPLGEALTDEERNEAEAMAADYFVAVDEETLNPEGGAQRAAEQQAAAAAGPTRTAAASKPEGITRMHLVLAGVGTFVIAAVLTFVIPMLTERYDATEAFRYIPGVRGYAGTPPVASVTVSAEEWKSLNGPGRTRLVAAVGAAMQKQGFTSVKVVTPDQKPVAEWVKDQGSKVY